jgi:hypothetical protein
MNTPSTGLPCGPDVPVTMAAAAAVASVTSGGMKMTMTLST